MLAMNARKKKYLSEALYQGIIRWVVSQIESLNHLYNYITQSGSWLLFYSLLIVIPQKMMKSETFSLEIESGCANTCCLAASKYKFRQLSQVI